MADEVNSTLGLLNGIAKREYYGNAEITDEFLKQELFPDYPEQEFESVHSKCSHILKTIASSGMDDTQLGAYLTSQAKKKGGITEKQATAFSKFWKNNKTKIHNVLVSRTTFGTTLKSVSWRIDVKAQSKTVDQINTPAAIVELQLTNKTDPQKGDQVIQFEMDEEKLTSLTNSLKEIEQRLQSYVK